MILRTSLTADGDAAQAGEVAVLTLHRTAAGLEVEIDAPFHGDPPPPTPPGALDGLWAFEVVELFIASPLGAGWAYTELEFSPHGHTLTLRFSAIRARQTATPLPHLDTAVRHEAGRWHARATVPVEWLPTAPEWHVNACAIHGETPRRYLTATELHTPRGKPDFHRPDQFQVWAMRVSP